MRLRHDIATRVTTTGLSNGEVPWIGRSHAEELIIELTNNGKIITGVTGDTNELPAAFQMMFKVKPANQRDTENLVTDDAGSDLILDATHWDADEGRRGALVITADTLNDAVDALLLVGNDDPDDDVVTVACDGELSYRVVDTDDWQQGKPFDVDLVASVHMAEDETATLTAASAGIRYYPAITGLTGGGTTKLDGIVTVSLSVPRMAFLVISGEPEFWQLATGTTAESSPSVIRPDDYNASTNAKVWTRLL